MNKLTLTHTLETSPTLSPTRDATDYLDSRIDREEVLSRIDPEELCTAPLNLLLSTAISLAPSDAAELTEDAVLRQTTALTDEQHAAVGHARLLAEAFVLTNVEYQSAITAYATADAQAPVMEHFKNPQHWIQALNVHERRMDRLMRGRKEAFERLQKASELYREAVLTRDGISFLRMVKLEVPTGEAFKSTIR